MKDIVSRKSPSAAPCRSPPGDGDDESNSAFILRLPHELLVEIFLLGRDSCQQIEHFLLTITSVCSVWRSAALNSPMLWTIIRRPNFKKVEHEVQYLEALLKRSKNSLLDIAFFDEFPCKFPAEIFQTIYSHLPRCRYLHLSLAKFSTDAIIFPLPGPLEHLSSLAIMSHSSFLAPQISIITLAQTPRLRQLAFTCRRDFSALQNLQSDNLVRVHLDGSMEKALHFLSRCPLVEEATIVTEVDLEFEDPINPEPMTLNHLTRLRIPGDPSMLFRHFLRAPKLQELVVDGIHPDDAHAIMESIGRPVIPYPPFECLKSLSFMGGDLRKPEFYRSIITHPRIETLSVVDCRDPIIIPALILLGDTNDKTHCQMLGTTEPPHEPGPFLPRLQELTVRDANESYTEVFIPYLFSLLESRSELTVVVTEDFLTDSDKAMRVRFGNRFLVQPAR